MRSFLLLAPFALFSACDTPCQDGYGKAADGNCYPFEGGGPSDDTGPEGDADTDSDADSDADYDGNFAGAFFIDVTDGSGTQDTCVGQSSITISGSSVTGTHSCGFNEDLASLPGSSGAITGTVDGDGVINGSIESSSYFSGTWNGFVGETTVDGTFTGSYDDGTVRLTYSGSLNAHSD
ncbi:MAG: hypothetical protein H6739_31285 [Alphaproteobacteria bacterium]|nr:hypothetical protein [Alphaproteobacteria bacterium]